MRRANYNKLFKLLIDKGMRKGELCKAANVSGGTLFKLTKRENVYMDILIRICDALDCEISDIMDLEPIEPDAINGGERQRTGKILRTGAKSGEKEN
jgi:DNA-binding Xre family transcriptional regulator